MAGAQRRDSVTALPDRQKPTHHFFLRPQRHSAVITRSVHHATESEFIRPGIIRVLQHSVERAANLLDDDAFVVHS